MKCLERKKTKQTPKKTQYIPRGLDFVTTGMLYVPLLMLSLVCQFLCSEVLVFYMGNSKNSLMLFSA